MLTDTLCSCLTALLWLYSSYTVVHNYVLFVIAVRILITSFFCTSIPSVFALQSIRQETRLKNTVELYIFAESLNGL